MITKTINFYVVTQEGEYASGPFIVQYHDLHGLKYIVEDIWEMLCPYVIIEDIYINECIYDDTSTLIEEVPLASMIEVRPKTVRIRYWMPNNSAVDTRSIKELVDALFVAPLKIRGRAKEVDGGIAREVNECSTNRKTCLLDIRVSICVGTTTPIKYCMIYYPGLTVAYPEHLLQTFNDWINTVTTVGKNGEDE